MALSKTAYCVCSVVPHATTVTLENVLFTRKTLCHVALRVAVARNLSIALVPNSQRSLLHLSRQAFSFPRKTRHETTAEQSQGIRSTPAGFSRRTLYRRLTRRIAAAIRGNAQRRRAHSCFPAGQRI